MSPFSQLHQNISSYLFLLNRYDSFNKKLGVLRNRKKGSDRSNVFNETGYHVPLLEHLKLLFLNYLVIGSLERVLNNPRMVV